MQTLNSQSPENSSPNEDSVIMSKPLIQSLRDLILSFDHREMAEALRLVHDTTLYFSDITLEEKEKSALFELKILREGFKCIKETSCNFWRAVGASPLFISQSCFPSLGTRILLSGHHYYFVLFVRIEYRSVSVQNCLS